MRTLVFDVKIASPESGTPILALKTPFRKPEQRFWRQKRLCGNRDGDFGVKNVVPDFGATILTPKTSLRKPERRF